MFVDKTVEKILRAIRNGTNQSTFKTYEAAIDEISRLQAEIAQLKYFSQRVRGRPPKPKNYSTPQKSQKSRGGAPVKYPKEFRIIILAIVDEEIKPRLAKRLLKPTVTDMELAKEINNNTPIRQRTSEIKKFLQFLKDCRDITGIRQKRKTPK